MTSGFDTTKQYTLADTCIRDDVPVYVSNCNELISIINPSQRKCILLLKSLEANIFQIGYEKPIILVGYIVHKLTLAKVKR